MIRLKERYFTLKFWKHLLLHRLSLIERRLLLPIISRRQSSLNFNLSQAIVIFGTPRGGTTWLMETLGKLGGMVPNFEPLHGAQGIIPSELNLKNFNPERDEKINQAVVQFFEQVFTGKLFNFWTTIYTRLDHFNNPAFILTKTIRAHHLLSFLARRIDFHHPPILLLRHPIPTCQSQLKAFGNNGKATRLTVREIENGSALLGQHRKILLAPHSHLAYKVLIWCINHLQFLNDRKVMNRLVVVFYEDLLLNPAQEMKRIIDELGLEGVPDSELKKIDFLKASKTDFKSEFQPSPVRQLEKGLLRLSASEKEEIQAILDYFEIGVYSAYSPFPLKEKLPL